MHSSVRRRPARLVAVASLLAALAPSTARALDSDRDGVDDTLDDCVGVANPAQRDSNLDGYGNACDADFDGDGVVGFGDLRAVEAAVGAGTASAGYSADLDLDGDGVIGLGDVLETRRRVGTAPGPSALACAGSVPCTRGVLVLDKVEEVLSRSVRLTWSASTPSFSVKVQRRVAGTTAWELVGLLGGGEQAFVDGGPDGRGLAPGSYEYRVQAEAGPSPARRIDLVEECAGQPPTSPLLPVVEIVDREPDGDYDGDDVRGALAACSQLHGCILRALPVVYRDVNVELANATRYAFPRGLVIEGYGSATLFRSRVFSQQDHDPSLCPAGTPAPCYRPQPVFAISQAGGTILDGVRFRNFQIDGRKGEQPDPGTPENTWFHWGIGMVSSVAESTDGGCVHHVAARNLMTGGFGVQRGVGWIFERNTVEDVGCQDDLTPCPGLVRTPEYLTIPGVRSTGFGIVAGLTSDLTVIRNNRVVRATKYGVASVGTDSLRAQLVDNDIEEIGAAGIQCNSCSGARIERNLIRSMHYPRGRNAAWPNGFGGEVAQGINCTGPGREIRIANNIMMGGDGSGLRLQCAGPNVVAEGNAIVDNCRRYGQTLFVGESDGTIVRNNQLRDSASGCRWSVLVNGARNALIDGNAIESGPGTQVGLFVAGGSTTPTTGLVLRRLRLSTRGSTGVAVELVPPSSGTTVYDSVCSSGFATRLVDLSSGGTRALSEATGSCAP